MKHLMDQLEERILQTDQLKKTLQSIALILIFDVRNMNHGLQQNVHFAIVGSFFRADWVMLLDQEKWSYLSRES